jgi:23S rRNA (adenine2503-C2)-methyltransferase
MVNLLGMTRTDLEAFFRDLGEKPYRATQAMKWIYRAGVTDFEAMTDMARPLRRRLAAIAEIRAPEFGPGHRAADGVVKWAATAGGDQTVETVLIPDVSANGTKRNTLCISSQVGCVLDCSFCATGKQGFRANLSRAEIVGQAWQAARLLPPGETITNVVFMGMGEPLMNFDAAMDAVDVFMDHLAFGISKRRVTVSTAGVVPRIYDMAQRTDVSLAISLHAPNDELRDALVPLNRKYPIGELLAACRYYLDTMGERRTITIEYTLIDGVNDRREDAEALLVLLAGMRAKVNLIPFNPFPVANGCPPTYRRPSRNRVLYFQRQLLAGGLPVMLRTTRGDDIAAACGQLTGAFEDRTRRRARYRRRGAEGPADDALIARENAA